MQTQPHHITYFRGRWSLSVFVFVCVCVNNVHIRCLNRTIRRPGRLNHHTMQNTRPIPSKCFDSLSTRFHPYRMTRPCHCVPIISFTLQRLHFSLTIDHATLDCCYVRIQFFCAFGACASIFCTRSFLWPSFGRLFKLKHIHKFGMFIFVRKEFKIESWNFCFCHSVLV